MEIKSKTEQLILQKIRGEKNSRDAIPLLKDLNANGFNIVDFNDLTLEKSRYKEALPILLKWIDQIKNPDIADTLVRAVSVPWAKRIAVPVLLKKLISERGSDNKELTWSIGNALYFVADKTNIEELLDICKDPAYGDARQMIVLKIGLMKIKKAEDILLSIIDQESVTGHTISALGYIGSKKSVPILNRYLQDQNPWIRKQAKNALLRIEKCKDEDGQ